MVLARCSAGAEPERRHDQRRQGRPSPPVRGSAVVNPRSTASASVSRSSGSGGRSRPNCEPTPTAVSARPSAGRRRPWGRPHGADRAAGGASHDEPYARAVGVRMAVRRTRAYIPGVRRDRRAGMARGPTTGAPPADHGESTTRTPRSNRS